MRRTTRVLLALGYGLLSLCGAAQWIHTLWTRQALGLSVLFLGLFAAGLAVLQVALWLGRERRSIQIGNALGLANALMMLLAWWWVR
ncbi:MAG: hypothetical protein V1806_17385 [Pseudomonadota bacterium]